MYGHGAPSPPRLDVYRTVGEAFRLTFRNFRTMLGLAIAPMVLAVLLPAVMRLDLQTMASSELLIIHAVARLFLLSVFAVAWHRYLLLGTRDTGIAIQFWPGMRDLKYFGRLIIFLLPQEIVLVAMQAQNLLVVLLLLLITLFVAAPFAFAFPATAVDNYHGLAAARRALRGATLQLVGAILLSFVAITILLFLLGRRLRNPGARQFRTRRHGVVLQRAHLPDRGRSGGRGLGRLPQARRPRHPRRSRRRPCGLDLSGRCGCTPDNSLTASPVESGPRAP